MEKLPKEGVTGVLHSVIMEAVLEQGGISKLEGAKNKTRNQDQLKKDIERYFTKDELQDWEKEVYRDIKEHYDVIISFGYDVPKPDFMSEVEETHQFPVCLSTRFKQEESLLPENCLLSDVNESAWSPSSNIHPISNSANVEQSEEKRKEENKHQLPEQSFMETSIIQKDKSKTLYDFSECGKHFSQSSNLNVRQKVQSLEKPSKCGECWRRLRGPTDLNTREKIQTGEKPSKNIKCVKGIQYSSNLHKCLQTQMRKKHTKSKEYKKSISQRKEFIGQQHMNRADNSNNCSALGNESSSELRVHQQIHPGEKPYKSAECGKNYTRSSSFSNHKRIHGGEKPYKCEECRKSFITSSRLFVNNFTKQRNHINV
ncbi:zinc finger protein 184-like [Latimeria chalumnae]|uniref:zinc finger protein 184-like n=1 Tax=Latimeria chalumnae TaxID=7897 RepID=UPI00313EB168